MRKIVGFKLNLRLREVLRRAKKAGLDPAGGGEAELEAWLARASKAAAPAVLFETFPHPDADQPLLSPMPGLAYSLVLATVGDGLRALAEEAGQGPSRLGALAEELALEDCLRFAAAIIQEEAAKESCELSPSTPLCEPAALEAVLRKLEGSKIGVRLAQGRLTPTASLASSLSWLSKSKAKGRAK